MSNYSMKAFVISTVGGREWTALCMILFTPVEKIPGTHWIGSWVGQKVCRDTSERRKVLCPCGELNTSLLIVQFVG